MLAIMIVIAAFGYLMVGGLAFSKIQTVGRAKCKYYPRSCDSTCGHSVLAGASVFAWPVTAPILVGSALGQRPSREQRTADKLEARRQRELDEARHTRALEKEMGIG